MSVAATETEVQKAQEATQGAEGEAPMVSLSDKAAEKVKEIRGEENIEESYALRLKVQGGGCSGFSYDLYFDQPQESDRPFEIKGVKLICDEMSLMYLRGNRDRLRRRSARRRVQVQQPERQVDLRLRQLVQRLVVRSSRHSPPRRQRRGWACRVPRGSS